MVRRRKSSDRRPQEGNVIVLATGNKVAPMQVEQLLTGSPWDQQCCIVGDGRKCLAARSFPIPDLLRQEIRRRRLLGRGSEPSRIRKIIALYRQEIDRCLAAAASFEQVGPFMLLGRGFSLEAGELTPKLSLRRGEIERAFSGEIETMYRKASEMPGARKTRLAELVNLLFLTPDS